MKVFLLYSLAIVALVLGTGSITAQTPPERGLILPGKGVSGVDLDSNFSAFEAVFPKHPQFDEDTPNTQCGAGRVYHWLDIDKRANGVYVYLKSGRIYQISVQTPRFALPDGIKINASERAVKAAYPNGRAYVLLGSGMAAMGGKDLIYWVSKGRGVAFELSWDQRKKRRFVRAIDVFQEGTAFFPEGCISPPQKLQALKSLK